VLTVEDGDIILFNINQEGGLAKLKAQKNIPDNRVVYVGIDDGVELDPYWFLKKSESGPPSLRALVMLLNNISVFLAEKQEHNNSEATEFKSNLDTPTIKIETIPEPKKDLGSELEGAWRCVFQEVADLGAMNKMVLSNTLMAEVTEEKLMNIY